MIPKKDRLYERIQFLLNQPHQTDWKPTPELDAVLERVSEMLAKGGHSQNLSDRELALIVALCPAPAPATPVVEAPANGVKGGGKRADAGPRGNS